MYRYSLSGSLLNCFKFSHDVIYDDIVDDSNYVIDAENTRNALLNGAGLNGQNLKYDGDNLPDDTTVLIRQGKLDKAEIYQMQLKLQDDIKTTVEAEKKASKSKKLADVAQARQDFIDKTIGFDSSDLTK